MGFKYRNLYDSQFIQLAATCYLGGDSDAPTSGLYHHQWMGDRVLPSLDASVFPLGTFYVRETIGLVRPPVGGGSWSVLDTKPTPMPYSATSDWDAYGSNLYGLEQAASLLRNGKLAVFSQDGDHSVVHSSYQGRIGGFRVPESLFPPALGSIPCNRQTIYGDYSSVWLPPVTVKVMSVDSLPAQNIVLQDVAPVVGDRYSLWDYPTTVCGRQLTTEVLALLQELGTLEDTIDYGGDGLAVYTTVINSVNVSRFRWSISYDTVFEQFRDWDPVWPYTYVKVGNTISYEFLYDPTPYHAEYGIDGDGVYSFRVRFPGNIVARRHCWVDDTNRGDLAAWFPLSRYYGGDSDITFTLHNGDFPDQQFGDMPLNMVCAWTPVFTAQGETDPPRLAQLGKDGLTYGLRHEVERYLGDIRLSSFKAASDALGDLAGGIDSDVLQTLVKVNDLSSLIPNIKDAIIGLRSIVSGDIPSGILSLIDMVTSLRLQSQFTYRPDLLLLQKQLPEMLSLMRTFHKSRPNIVSSRGSFHYEFPQGTFGREESHLETHATVFCNRDSDHVLSSILDVRSLGILPGPANAWDLVPFSFIVNWFTGVGQRIRDLENSAFLILLSPRRFVYSYKIWSPLTQHELEKYHILRDDGEDLPPRLVYYRRDVSAYPPRIGDGRFDFGMPTRLPDWETSLSLTWQLLLRH